MKKDLGFKCEKAIRLLTKHMINDGWKKPALFHSIRVGTHLYEKGYEDNIVLGGFLHDLLEDGVDISEDIIQTEFNEFILEIVKANSKNESIKDKNQKREDLIERCVKAGKEALVVKASDILDNFYYYEITNNIDELLNHCVPHAELLLKKKPENIKDVIFEDLKLKIKQTLINHS